MERLKHVSGTVTGVLLLLLFLTLPVVLLLGAAEFSVWALEWIPSTFALGAGACLLLLPLAAIPVTRGAAAGFYGVISFLFGACIWLYALAFTYLEWGMIAVVVGVLLAGVGVIFTGLLAALFSGAWAVLGNIALLFAFFAGSRILSIWLSSLAEERRLEKEARERPSGVTVIQSVESLDR